MLDNLLFFIFDAPPAEFAVYGLDSNWFGGSSPPVIEVTERGCATCLLVRQFISGVEVRRFKRTRAGISVVPYCGACYTFPPE